MQWFKQTLDESQLMELELHGRKFTWSNEQDVPTFTRIDRMFGTPEWHLLFPNTDLQALATMGSDHAPLILTGDVARQNYNGFRFESYWTSMTGFMETVQEVWAQPVNTQDAILKIHVKLIRTAKALKLWRWQKLGNLPLRLAMVNELILLYDRTQEHRALTQEELAFCGYLKAKSVGLGTIQRSRARQNSRLTWLRKGDACTKFFMIHAGHRKRKLFIPSLINSVGNMVTGHQQK